MITTMKCDNGYIAQLDGYDFIGDGDTPEDAKKDLLEVLDDIVSFATPGEELNKLKNAIAEVGE